MGVVCAGAYIIWGVVCAGACVIGGVGLRRVVPEHGTSCSLELTSTDICMRFQGFEVIHGL